MAISQPSKCQAASQIMLCIGLHSGNCRLLWPTSCLNLGATEMKLRLSNVQKSYMRHAEHSTDTSFTTLVASLLLVSQACYSVLQCAKVGFINNLAQMLLRWSTELSSLLLNPIGLQGHPISRMSKAATTTSPPVAIDVLSWDDHVIYPGQLV